LTENVIEKQREEQTYYEYDEYRINVFSRSGLYELVESSFDTWIDFCKLMTPEQIPTIEEQLSALQQAVIDIALGGQIV
jgi:hypothetical protein